MEGNTHATGQAPSGAHHEKDARQATLRTLKVALFLISMPLGLLGFLLPVYGNALGADAVQIGLFFSVFSLTMVLLRPLVGAGLDRIGRRPFALAGMAGYAIAMFAFSLIDRVWSVIVARAVQGAAAAFLWIAVDVITSDLAGEHARGRFFGGVGQASNQGSVLGTFLGIAVLTQSGVRDPWALLFAVYGIVGLIAVAIAWIRLPETRRTRRQDTRQPVAWSRPWVLLLLLAAVTSASGAMVGPIALFYLQDRLAATAEQVGYAYLPAALVGAFLSAWLGRLADRWGRKPLMLLGMAVAAVSSLVLPIIGSLVALAALRVVQAASGAASGPATQALVADLTGDDRRGRAYGMYALAGGLGATVGPFLGGWLYEHVNPAAPFVGNGIVLALSLVVLWAWLRVPRSGTQHNNVAERQHDGDRAAASSPSC